MKKRLFHFFTDTIANPERLRWSFCSAFLFFLIGNGFAYIQFSPIHDAIDFVFGASAPWQIQLGRFLIPLYLKIRGSVPMPLPLFFLSCFYLCISEYTVVRILNLKSRLSVLLVCALLSVNIFTTEISALHQYFADVFLLSLCLSCLGIYCFHDGVTVKKCILSFLCLFISFGLYPAFFTFALCLAVLMMLEFIYEGKMKQVKKTVLALLAVFAFSGIAYMTGSRLALKIADVTPSQVNQSMFSVGRLSIKGLLQSAALNYRYFFNVFYDGGAYTGHASGIAAIILSVIAIAVFFSKQKVAIILLTSILFFLFPAGSRLVNIMTEHVTAYRTMYAQFLLFPIMIWLFFRGLRKLMISEHMKQLLITAVTLLSSIIIWQNIQFSNTAFVWQNILYERSVYHAGQILEDIQEYQEDDLPVAIVGIIKLDVSNIPDYQRYRRISGFGSDTGISYEMMFSRFAKLLGYDINYKSAYADAVRNTEKVRAMPCYPADGYIEPFDGYLVVKLSD